MPAVGSACLSGVVAMYDLRTTLTAGVEAMSRLKSGQLANGSRGDAAGKNRRWSRSRASVALLERSVKQKVVPHAGTVTEMVTRLRNLHTTGPKT